LLHCTNSFSPLVGRQGGGEERSGTPTAEKKSFFVQQVLPLAVVGMQYSLSALAYQQQEGALYQFSAKTLRSSFSEIFLF